MSTPLSIKDQKARLRQELLQQRLAMPVSKWKAANRSIIQRLKDLPEVNTDGAVHIYLPISGKKEIDTLPFVRWLLEQKRPVAVPITQFETLSLRHVLLTDLNHLVPNRWGVPEPETHQEIPLDDIGLVVVPMLGGDRYKNRLGYGKGFYDRFLKEVQCPTVGLLHHAGMVEQLPVDSFDVALGHIITEKIVL